MLRNLAKATSAALRELIDVSKLSFLYPGFVFEQKMLFMPRDLMPVFLFSLLERDFSRNINTFLGKKTYLDIHLLCIMSSICLWLLDKNLNTST